LMDQLVLLGQMRYGILQVRMAAVPHTL
jgi:hypothetical protein